MGRNRKRIPLNVFLNSRHVGQLVRATSGAVEFRYGEDWLAWEHALPISLSLPLRSERYVGAPVLAVFENLLPDTDAVRQQVATRVGAEGTDAYNLLSAVGRDCVGALQFMSEGEEPGLAGQVTGTPVTDDEIADGRGR